MTHCHSLIFNAFPDILFNSLSSEFFSFFLRIFLKPEIVERLKDIHKNKIEIMLTGTKKFAITVDNNCLKTISGNKQYDSNGKKDKIGI